MTDLARLLGSIAAFIRRYVVLNEAQLTVATLWTFHSHAFDAADATPYLSITSAEKESGKTRLLEVLELLVARPWFTARISAAVLARKVDKVTPTLLLDKSDAAFKAEKEYAETLRSLLNSGYRRGGRSSLCVGQGANIDYVDLSTFCPKAIAGLDQLPDTVASRSIPIRLKRKGPGESVERFRRREAEEVAEPLYQALASFGTHSVETLAAARPELPDALGDRAADVCEPLLAIADLAGGEWPERARQAAVELSGRGTRDEGSAGVVLLRDIRGIFDRRGVDRLASSALCGALHEIEESPWGEWYGKPITARGIAKILKRFEIEPQQLRFGDENHRGYERAWFEDAWTRHLSSPPDVSATTLQTAAEQGFSPEPIRYTAGDVADTEESANPHEQTDVADVADTPGANGDFDDFEVDESDFGPYDDCELERLAEKHRDIKNGLPESERERAEWRNQATRMVLAAEEEKRAEADARLRAELERENEA